MDDEEGRARYWIWPLRIHAVVSCKNRSSHRRRDYLTSKGSHWNSRHRRRQHRDPPGGEGAAMEATPSPPQHGRHLPCLHLQKPRLLHNKLAYIQVHARIPHRFPTLPTPARPSERRNRRGASAESEIASSAPLSCFNDPAEMGLGPLGHGPNNLLFIFQQVFL